jgi:endonuclease/exonuclease/phosphatase family metal-dependent hydrolase
VTLRQETGPRAEEDPHLTIVSFNLRHGAAPDGRYLWPFRRAAALSSLRELDADLLGLQEVLTFQQSFLLERLAGYRAVGRYRGRFTGERSPIMYRAGRLRLLWEATRWLSPQPEIPGSRGFGALLPRIATVARFRYSGTGSHFGLLNTHLDSRSAEARRESARLLLTWLDPDLPWVISGDLNETSGDPALLTLLQAGFIDPLRHLGDSGPGAGTFHGYAETSAGRRIDHVLLRGPWVVRRAFIDARPARLASDHWPVVVEARLAT